MMKLISITKVKNHYEVKAQLTYLLLGIQFYSKNVFFIKEENSKDWFIMNSRKKVTKEQQIRLNKWLKDHRKFLEKK